MSTLEALLRDLRFGVRMLVKNPLFTVTAVATLGLCIGVNSTVYTVVDRVLLSPLPYPDPGRLVQIVMHAEGAGLEDDEIGQTGATWEQLRDGLTTLEPAATAGGFGTIGVNLVAHGHAEYVQQQRVSAGFFRVLGVSPALGREFSAEEDRPNGPALAILSHAVWRRLFDADPAAIGRAMLLRGEPYTIVGVMPERFRGSAPVDVWTPARPSRRGEGGGQNYDILGRIRPGATWAQADAQVAAIGEPIIRDLYPHPRVPLRLRIVALQRTLTGEMRQPLLILWTAVAVVLLIGCVNIAGLLIARSAVRAPEIATRIALGGGRGAIVRQLLAESVVLAAAGGIAGIALGQLGVHASASLLEDALGVTADAALDGRVLIVTITASLLTSLVFGLVPAFQASRVDLRAAITDSGGTTVAGRARAWPRRAMVIAEVALGVMLLVGAGLLIRTFDHLMHLRAGFDSSRVITATLSLQDARYTTAAAVNQLFDRTVERMRRLGQVEHAAVCLTLPYERALNVGGRWAATAPPDDAVPLINLTYVTPEYFDALRIPIVRGRVFTDSDSERSVPVMIINEALARRYSRDRDPIGRQFMQGGTPRTVVGVVGDILQKAGWGNWGPIAAIPAAYVPARQVSGQVFMMVHTWFAPSWVVSATGTPASLPSELQRAVQSVDPQLTFAKFRTLDDVRGEALARQRAQAILLGSMAGLALLLAAVGIYGLVASSVTERTRELAVRIALGATPKRILTTAAAPGIGLGLAGIAIGLALARASARVMAALVWGVSVGDPPTFLIAAATVFVVALIAALVPSLRIFRMNPVRALREG